MKKLAPFAVALWLTAAWPTDRKSLLALRGVGPESEAESVRFYGRRVTRVGPEVKHEKAAAGGLEAAEQRGARAALGRCRTFQVAENATTGSVS